MGRESVYGEERGEMRGDLGGERVSGDSNGDDAHNLDEI